MNRIVRAALLAAFLLTGAAASAESGAAPGFMLDVRVADWPPGEIPFGPASVLGALAEAYPHRVERVGRRDGDWVALIGGTWLYWAGGRMLPEEERTNAAAFEPLEFYRYQPGMPATPDLTVAERARLDELVRVMDAEPPRRNTALADALWRVDGRRTSWDRQKTTFFLGLKTMVHREILEDLAAVEERILEAAEADPAVAAFIRSLATVEGYNYRRVDGTESLSNHAYGIAVDLIPQSYRGRQVYWRWAENAGVDWYELPQDDRFQIPSAVVEAFERHGFVWGGKWHFFDTMHFEYRPEILILNGFEVDLR